MHRNTFVFVTLLAVIAALLVGFNLGKKFNPPSSVIPSPTIVVSPTPEQIAMTHYTNTYCKIALSYPSTMTLTESASGSAKFASETDTVVLGCQKDIPGIAIPEENIESLNIGSISAKLYHTTTAKDGTLINVLLFHHPKTDMDVAVSGIGTTFTAIIHSLTLLP